jgi:hypothetical protein
LQQKGGKKRLTSTNAFLVIFIVQQQCCKFLLHHPFKKLEQKNHQCNSSRSCTSRRFKLLLLGDVVVKGVQRQNKIKQVGEARLNGGNECGIGLPFPRISMSSSNLLGLGTNLGSYALGQV